MINLNRCETDPDITMSNNTILAGKPGKKAFLLGNEAIARGAIEAGIGFATTYPGTPASEIGDNLFGVAQEAGFYFEYSVNEKVALEMAISACFSEVRSLVSMKHVGLNVASDPFVSIAYTGTRAGLVIVSAGDPSQHSSQNEQDNRLYSKLANLPMLEPSNPQEAYQMTKYGFKLSEELELPVLLVTTTRVNHSRGMVKLGNIPADRKRFGQFEKDPQRFVVIPSVGLKRHKVLLKAIQKAAHKSEDNSYNFIEGEGEIGIATSGVSSSYVQDGVSDLGLEDRVSILKLGFTHPLPEKLCKSFLKRVNRVLVVEEMTPYLEDQLKAPSQEMNVNIPIYGKKTGHLPRIYEYHPDQVKQALAQVAGENYSKPEPINLDQLPVRPPVLCPGCPHRATYYAVKSVVDEDTIFPSDIGCYTLGFLPPFNAADIMLCMGASVGTANGFSKATNQDIVAFIGDSTFYHSGVPPLINAVHNGSKFTLVVLDNQTTAMTGHQPHPGIESQEAGVKTRAVSIEKVAKGCGVEFVRTVNPFDLGPTKKAIKEAVEFDGLSVVISKGACPLMERKLKQREEVTKPVLYEVDQKVCTQCRICIEKFMCPAFYAQEGKIYIDDSLCNGCGVCVQVCPLDAIKPDKEAK